MLYKDRISLNTKTMEKRSEVDNFCPSPEVTNKGVEDAAFAVQISRRLLIILGVWRPKSSGEFSWRLVLANVSVIACCYGIGIRFIPTCIYIIIDRPNINRTLNLIARSLFSAMGWMKYLLLELHKRDIEKCMKHIEADWLGISSESGREIMLEYTRYERLMTRIFAGLTFSSGVLFAVLPFVFKSAGPSGTNDNTTMIIPPRTFSIASHFGFSVATQTPVYEIIYTSQVMGTFIVHTIGVTCYSLAVVIVMHACGQFKILMKMISDLINSSDESTSIDGFNGKMSNVIRHHARTLRFVSSAEKMLRGICLIDLGGCTIELCLMAYFNLLGYRAEKKDPVGLIVYWALFATFMFDIFSFCYISELLTQECAKIGETSYMTNWYHLPGKKSLVLCPIIAMAQNPVALTAGGAIQLSCRCFGSVIKTSLGYLNILLTMTE